MLRPLLHPHLCAAGAERPNTRGSRPGQTSTSARRRRTRPARGSTRPTTITSSPNRPAAAGGGVICMPPTAVYVVRDSPHETSGNDPAGSSSWSDCRPSPHVGGRHENMRMTPPPAATGQRPRLYSRERCALALDYCRRRRRGGEGRGLLPPAPRSSSAGLNLLALAPRRGVRGRAARGARCRAPPARVCAKNGRAQAQARCGLITANCNAPGVW
jgi:hypothetical protein